MMKRSGRSSVQWILFGILVAGLLVVSGLVVRGFASARLSELGIEVPLGGYAMLGLLVIAVVASSLGGLVVSARALLKLIRWSLGIPASQPVLSKL